MPLVTKITRRSRQTLLVCLIGLFISACPASSIQYSQSSVVKFPTGEVRGQGPYPYNLRVIDHHIFAGGHPFNPTNGLKNSGAEVLAILKYLKGEGVKTIIDLENTKSVSQMYSLLVKQEGFYFIHIPLSEMRVPDKNEWKSISTALSSPVYLHCYWGADRTGLIIAKYLMEKHGYSKEQALNAVMSGGTHAGYMGGMKKWFLLNHYFMGFLKPSL